MLAVGLRIPNLCRVRNIPAQEGTAQSSRGFLGKFLNLIERLGNRLPEPIVLFVFIALAIPLASAIASVAGWTLTHPTTGNPLQAVNLLTPEQLRRMLVEAVPNFVNFPPLGVVLVALLGVGIAEKSGLLSATLRLFVSALPGRVLTAGVVLAGIMSNIASDAGYVMLVPLAGVIFAGVGRHPVVGICAAFAGVSGGFSANLAISTLDPMMAGFTESAARLINASYSVNAAANYYFMAASTFLLTVGGTWITEKIVEPRLGTWKGGAEVTEPPSSISAAEKRGVLVAGLSVLILLGGIAFLAAPRDGFLRGENGSLDPFYKSLVPLMAVTFFVPGVLYGWIAGTVRSSRTGFRMLSETMASMGGYIVLAFVAAQFIAYFSWSNLGLMLAISGADVLRASGLPTWLLILGILLVTASVNLFIGSASAKWALMSPVLIPLGMELGLSPEMTQATYRVGDSTTNIITPLMPYFPIVLAFAQRWVPELKLGTLLSCMIPYSVGFLLLWSSFLVGWYFLNLPLGPDSPIHYQQAIASAP